MALPTGAKVFYARDKHKIGFGSGGTDPDVTLQFDGTSFIVDAVADDTLIEIGDSAATQKSFDVKWYGDTASGAAYLYQDASLKFVFTEDIDVKLNDSDDLIFGDGAAAAAVAGDVKMRWDGTDFDVLCTANNTIFKFGDGTTSFDLWVYGSAAASYFSWDASANDLKFEDSCSVMFGTGAGAGPGTAGDVEMRWDGTDFDILGAADDLILKIGNGTNSFDFWWYGNAATNTAVFDAGANTLTFDDVDVYLGDNDVLAFGDAQDVKIDWDGTNLDILAAADDQVMRFGTGTNSFDIWRYGNIATAYELWDASASTRRVLGPVRVDENVLGSRYNLKWVAGQRGKPSINADILNAAEATRMIADPDFEVLGLNATSDDVTFYAEGGVLLETDGADGDEVIVLPHLDANQSAWTQVTWGTDRQVEWECDIQTAANITNCIIWAGLKLTNTEVTATDADQAFFRYEDDVIAGNWQAIDSIGGVDNAVDSAVVVAINTRYHLKVTIGSDRVARFYINGVLVSTSAALTDATDLIPYIGVATDGAVAAKSLRVHGQAISRVIA